MNAADEAQTVEELDRAAGLRRVQQTIQRAQARPAAAVCRECGDDIPSARQALVPGTRHCTKCAALHEQRSRRGLVYA